MGHDHSQHHHPPKQNLGLIKFWAWFFAAFIIGLLVLFEILTHYQPDLFFQADLNQASKEALAPVIQTFA